MRIKEVSVDRVTEKDSVFQLVIFALMGVALGLILFALVGRVFAIAPAPYKVICHHNPAQNVTLSFQNVQSYNGHLGTPHNDEVYDTEGACVEPTPTDVQPTATPTPTIIDECDRDECITPTPTEEPVPTEAPVIPLTRTVGDSGTGLVDTSCKDLLVPEVPTIWVTDGTPSDGILNVQWGTNQYNRVDIRYSDDSNMDKYSLLNTENDGYESIGFLTIGNHYNFQVRFRNGCKTGPWSDPYDPVA